MRRHLRKLHEHKHLIMLTALLMFVSGCAGAVKKTGDQLTDDALSPVTVPIEGYKKGVDTVEKERDRLEKTNEQLKELDDLSQ
jgi:hypothetical protein